MKGAGFSARDRRALRIGLLVLGPALLFTYGVRPYLDIRTDLRANLAAERALLARELALLEDAGAFTARTAEMRTILASDADRLFEGPNEVSTAAALVAHVAERADEHRVLVQSSEGEHARPLAQGILELTMELRGMSDLEGILGLLRALERSRKLVRVEAVAIERAARGRVGAEENALAFSAVVTAYAMEAAAGEPDRPASALGGDEPAAPGLAAGGRP